MRKRPSFYRGLVTLVAPVAVLAACGGSGGGSAGGGGANAVAESDNLIVNGDAEPAAGSTDGSPVTTPGWTSAGEATAIQYGTSAYPALSDPGPPGPGTNFFGGGQDDTMSSLTQTIDVSQYAASIDTGNVTFTLSGWLGGYSSQADSATLTVTFNDTSGAALGTGSIGPVTDVARSDVTEFLQQSSSDAVPADTRSVLVVLEMTRVTGTTNDGYADDLSLVFDGI